MTIVASLEVKPTASTCAPSQVSPTRQHDIINKKVDGGRGGNGQKEKYENIQILTSFKGDATFSMGVILWIIIKEDYSFLVNLIATASFQLILLSDA